MEAITTQPLTERRTVVRSSPTAKAGHLPPLGAITTLSVIIPVYNERATIEELLRRVSSVEIPLQKEIIIVDDGSRDGTRELLAELEPAVNCSPRIRLKLVFQEKNQGKGAAIRSGLRHSSGDLVIIQDADLEYDPQDYQQLLKPILDGEADAVFGNRFHGGSHRVLYFWHAQANRMLTLVANMLTNLNLGDMEVGYKIFRRDVFDRIALRSNRFGFEPEITVKLARLNCRIYEVPISYHGRTYEEGKKIGWKDGAAVIYHLLRARFDSTPAA